MAYHRVTQVSRGEAHAAMMAARRPIREVGVPTVHRFGPYRFLFHSREHDPPHIPVESAGGKAVFALSPVELSNSTGYTRRETHEIHQIVLTHRHAFLRRWHEYFKQYRLDPAA